ncbi:MAG: TatD family hydrolase [Oscillospiraceae bacterium]|nr:TatD family hydrolase [Oscillospiraceae bacterium]
MLFETHAHYDTRQFDDDRDALLSSLPDQGVGWVVDPGCDIASSRRAVELARKFPHVYAAVGIHPEDCAGYSAEDLAAIRALAVENPAQVVAIGEIGLDYYWPENPDRDTQKRCFRDHLALARELDLPAIVHNREAHQDCLSIVKEFPGVRGVFHCYSGAVEDAKTLVALGWMLSFTGSVTYKNARKAPEVVAALPLDRIMIETDSPYLAPVPVRGRRNDSRNLVYIRDKIAEIRGISPEEVERATTENALRFFGLGD